MSVEDGEVSMHLSDQAPVPVTLEMDKMSFTFPSEVCEVSTSWFR